MNSRSFSDNSKHQLNEKDIAYLVGTAGARISGHGGNRPAQFEEKMSDLRQAI